MSRPRQVVPGRCYLVTRRCLERRYFLRPDQVVNESFWYVLGYTAQKYDIGIVAACAMSNHYHLEIVDRRGCFPDFLRDFNSLLARCINAHRGRWENFWSGTQTSMVHLIDGESQLDKAAYVVCNPVKDDLVSSAHAWPGASSAVAISQRRTIIAKRPPHFFRDNKRSGHMPSSVTIQFVPPPAFQSNAEEFIALLNARIATEEARAESVRRQKKTTIVGRRGVLIQHWNCAPRSIERRRSLRPRVAAHDRWARVEAIERNRAFEKSHRECLIAFRRRGLAETAEHGPLIFPLGTWLMVQRYHVAAQSVHDSLNAST